MQFRRGEINKMKDIFIAETHEQHAMSKMLSKYFAAFDYFDKITMISFISSKR